jgi:MoaE-MoaD fusion protein
MMTVRVRLFAIQRELAGTREVALTLPAGASVEAAWASLVDRFPQLAPGGSSVRFARNGDYVDVEERLADGDELACIPPVSGGDLTAEGAAAPRLPAEGAAALRRHLQIRAEPFGAEILAQLSEVITTDHDGAVVGFIGRTRLTPGMPAPGQEAEAARHAGREVESLTYEAHEPMALAVLGQIADEIAERFGVVRLAIVHRVGEVPLGAASIAIVAVSSHRQAAFDAARYAIDETKARVPIWKAEQFGDGHVWIGEPARAAAIDDSDAAGRRPPGAGLGSTS